jgi:uncharacterized protein
MTRTILITGGTGLIGRALSEEFAEQGFKVIVYTRNPEENKKYATDFVRYAPWDVEAGTYDRVALQAADIIVHLAGENIAAKKWTPKRKEEIVNSRLRSSELLIKAIRETPNKVKTIVSASAIGWYGPDPKIPNPRPFVETDEHYPDFLGETCKQWEDSIQPVAFFGKRLVKIRTGLVLTNQGGVFPELKKSLRFGAAGILGGGKQVMSWIHMDDLVRIYLHVINDDRLYGPFNAVSPKPVSNKELVVKLAKQIKGSFFVPLHIPNFALRLALGEMSIEVLKSATVSCDKIRKAGFNFVFPSIESALHELAPLKRSSRVVLNRP